MDGVVRGEERDNRLCVKGDDMRIPIVFATDENYLFFTCVAITSVARSAGTDTFYQIYILTAPCFTDSTGLLKRVQLRYSNIHIEVVYVDEKIFQNATIHNAHVTKATFYRLVLCDLIEEETCLYLDGDVIVTEDLQELYQIEMGENYLAGCRDIWIDLLSEEDRETRRERTGIPSMDMYINAGVLLFNLKRLKADEMDKIFISQIQQDYLFEDQDILNVCCYGKILRLPAKWNIFTLFMGQAGRMRAAGICEDTLRAFYEKRGIIHYATPMIRPWKRRNCWLCDEWWDIAEEWADEPALQKIKNEINEYEQKIAWDYYVDLCDKYDQIVIFGYTRYSERLCDWIRKRKEDRQIVFGDNSIEKQGQQYDGIPILSLEQIMKWKAAVPDEKTLFLIASQRRGEEVRDFLIGQGINEEHMDFYRRKDENYYLFLDDRYYRDELEDICKREDRDWGVFCRLSLEAIQEKLRRDRAYEGWDETYYLDRWILKE